ncbi:MAG: neutral/alkaline non-lysosomal ceramidase N-terminal domain-containing protein [Verrucomicrobiae bacterium]|nr:neutral/alkaline non-lysosomal ceramidase N-terminal domain-containing protein [Verrucomicrobiae bacterium]
MNASHVPGLALSGLIVAAHLAASAGELRLGTAAVNITPPLGTPLAGYYHERPCDGVLDELFAKAAVFDDGNTKAALVVCDLVTLPRSIVLEARRRIAERTDLPGSNVMIAATHTHTGPVLIRDSTLDAVTGANSPRARQYNAELPERIAQAVADASARRAPARVSFARETEARIAFNRRYWMKDGSVGWNPGKRNPDILRPAGPIDPEVGVVYFESPDGRPVLTFVNYALHPDTTGGTRASADFPGALARRLAEIKGPDMLTIFANGASGDVNHLDVRWAARQSGPEEANRIGTILAAAVLSAYTRLQPVSDTTLRVHSEMLRLALPEISDAALERARAVAKLGPQAKFLERVDAYKVLDVAAREGKPWDVEVQVITLGADLAWVSMPGELFVEPGLNLKAASPFRQTHIVELANGSIGYIPKRSAYAEGNYEVLAARCAAGSAEELVAAALRLLERSARAQPQRPAPGAD